MKCETPARASGSSREPAPTQNPSATERTPGTCSEMTRSPVESSVSSCLDTGGSYPSSPVAACSRGSRPGSCSHSLRGSMGSSSPQTRPTPWRPHQQPKERNVASPPRSTRPTPCFHNAVHASLRHHGVGSALVRRVMARSRTVFEDVNRDGAHQSTEPALAGRQLYLFRGDTYIGTTLADTDGQYEFSDVADGGYSIECEGSGLRAHWVPSTTPSLTRRCGHRQRRWERARRFRLAPPRPLHRPQHSADDLCRLHRTPRRDVQLRAARAGTVRPSHDGHARRAGCRIGDYPFRVRGRQHDNHRRPGVERPYSNFLAVMHIGWGSWLNTGEQALFHEYGHAWSLYHAYIVQQDPTFAGYLAVRGLTNDPRLGTSYSWSPHDSSPRLSGSFSARPPVRTGRNEYGSSGRHQCLDWPSFSHRPSGSLLPRLRPVPESIPVDVSGLAMSPTLVDKSGTASFTLNTAARRRSTSAPPRVLSSVPSPQMPPGRGQCQPRVEPPQLHRPACEARIVCALRASASTRPGTPIRRLRRSPSP